MKDLLVFGFVLALAAGGAFSLANRDPGGRLVACASLSEGSWFAAEYCGSPGSAGEAIARAELEEFSKVAAR